MLQVLDGDGGGGASQLQGGLVPLKSKWLVKRRCTRAGGIRLDQLDIQICFQLSIIRGGGQGSLSTNSPHSTEGVKNTEEFPMIGVKPLLGDEDGPSAHIFEAKI